jgi:hypothetical protein
MFCFFVFVSGGVVGFISTILLKLTSRRKEGNGTTVSIPARKLSSLSFVRSMFHIKVFENLVRIKKRKRKKKQNKTTTEKGGKSGRS